MDQVIGRGNVVAGFIPEKGKAQQRRVKKKEHNEENGKDTP
jgi:hypothetical protein